MLKKYIIFIAFVAFLSLITTRIAESSFSALEKEKKEQAIEVKVASIERMSVPELIEYLAPENATELKKVAWCESRYNPQAINYNDGGKGKHSVGILQFQESTFLAYEKKLGEDLNYYSSFDQIKVANYMVEQGQIHQWSCARLTGLV